MSGVQRGERVLGLYPHYRGIAFALFESPLSPVDWGLKQIEGTRRSVRILQAAQTLIERLQPDVLALGAGADPHGRRSKRIRRLQRSIAGYAESQAIEVHTFLRSDIRACFKGVGAVTRDEIAQAIAAQVPALSHRLPPPRKIWKTEDPRIKLFDAASLVMTFYSQSGSSTPRDECST